METFLKKTTLKRFNLTDFRFSCFLGKGASGSVYKHVQNNYTYTVKVLNKGGWEEDEFYEDLLWQTEIIKQMGELEKSIQFLGYDVVQKDNVETIAFIMEYFETNGDLYDHINSKVYWEKNYDNKGYCFKRGYIYKRYIMPQSEKIQITKSFLEAVEEIHSKRVGIVHGDIKTNNLLLDKQDNIKLIDFGASIFSEENDGLCKTDWNHGTLGYSSPEDTYHNLLGKASDIYSLGVSLIEVWSGSIWEDGHDFQTCRNEVLRSLRLIEKNDKEIGTILRKMVSVNSKKRPNIEKVINYFINKIF
jgi:non-specific serine/threonine protein kinase